MLDASMEHVKLCGMRHSAQPMEQLSLALGARPAMYAVLQGRLSAHLDQHEEHGLQLVSRMRHAQHASV